MSAYIAVQEADPNMVVNGQYPAARYKAILSTLIKRNQLQDKKSKKKD